jgi:hypothetical protein|eukprot:COSAG01_NODE_2138_length_8325_cov_307.344396_7_plen_95_part_00
MNGTMLLAWKNGVASEDKRGQQILFSVSADARAWSKAETLFPDMSTSKQDAAMFVGPPIQIRGRWYVGASPVRVQQYQIHVVTVGCACLTPRGL